MTALKFSGDTIVEGEIADRLCGRICLEGSSCRLEIAGGGTAENFRAHLQGGARVFIGERCSLDRMRIFAVGAEISIGPQCGFQGNSSLYCHEGQVIRIGKRCLFAAETIVTTSDMHSVLDAASGKRVNPPRSISIGDHVWVGRSSFILKGSRIADDCIIGCASVVTASLNAPANSLIAGNPAVVVRRNVNWDINLLPFDT
jgi:acetyltransferase-like isoleucine patch superfamily enzyme